MQELLVNDNVAPIMSGQSDYYDNAPAESFFNTPKVELVDHPVGPTRQEAMTDIFFHIEGFYIRTRRYSARAFLSPAAFEAAKGRQPVFLELRLRVH